MPIRSRSSARSLTLTMIGVGALVLAGCSANGLSPRGRYLSHDKRLAAFPIPDADYATAGYRRDWIGYPVLSRGQTVEEISVYKDLVFAREGGSIVTALESDTGNQRWFTELANPLTKFVGIERNDDRVLVASEAELFFIDTETGTLRDRQSYGSIVSTRPVLSGALAVFGTGRGEILGHLTIQGVKLWGHLMEGSIDYDLVRVGDAIGAITNTGRIAFVHHSSGSLLGATRIFEGIASNPVTDGTLAFIASTDQSIYAFNPFGAEQVWRHRTAYPIRSQPVYHRGSLYCTLRDEGLVAFNPADGTVRWKMSDVTGTVIGSRNKRVLVWSGEELCVIDPARGDLINRMTLPGVAHIEMDAESDGNLYVISHSGVVARFVPRS